MSRLGPWPIRVLWIAQPFVLGPALGAALDERSGAVQLVAAGLAWAGWTAGVLAVLLPRTLGLTALRILAPAAGALAVWSSVQIDDVGPGVLAVAGAAVAAVWSLAPSTGDLFVNGSAYGDERRFALRPPAAVVLGPVVVVWTVVVAGLACGPLLLAAERWGVGAAATVVGLPAAAVATRSLHQLARRWLVMVPAGLVIHDPTVVTSQLLRRGTIGRIGPAPADSGALDLTGGALGLALQIELREAATLELIRRRGGRPTVVHATAVMLTPTRPGAVVAEASSRRLPVG